MILYFVFFKFKLVFFLNAYTARLSDVKMQLQQLQTSTSEASSLTQAAIEKLSKEKEDLLQLAMTRDRVIQVSLL